MRSPHVTSQGPEVTLPWAVWPFEPTNVEVEQPGRYEITFLNDGAILHDITFADGTVLAAEPGETVTGEVVVPSAGLEYICSIPGHADGGLFQAGDGGAAVDGGH